MSRIVAICILLALSGFAHANPVLHLAVSTQQGAYVTNGSAILINQRTGCFITNQHLSIYADLVQLKLTIKTSGYFTRWYNATVRWEHPWEDLALVCVEPDDALPPSAQRGATSHDRGACYTAEGYPGYAEGFRSASVRLEGVKQIEPVQPREVDNISRRLAQFGVSKHPVVLSGTNLTVVSPTDNEDKNQKFGGFSGGGIFDADNRLIGVIGRGDSGRNYLFAIPIETIPHQFFEK